MAACRTSLTAPRRQPRPAPSRAAGRLLCLTAPFGLGRPSRRACVVATSAILFSCWVSSLWRAWLPSRQFHARYLAADAVRQARFDAHLGAWSTGLFVTVGFFRRHALPPCEPDKGEGRWPDRLQPGIPAGRPLVREASTRNTDRDGAAAQDGLDACGGGLGLVAQACGAHG